EELFQPVHTATFVIDGQQSRSAGHVAETAREIVDLIEIFDVSLKKQKPAGLNGFDQHPGFTVQFVSLEPKDEELTYFLFKREVILHGSMWPFFSGPPKPATPPVRSEEHTSELQSLRQL